MASNRSLLFDELHIPSRDPRPWVIDHPSAALPNAVPTGTTAYLTRTQVAEAAARAATLFEQQGTGIGDYCVVWMDSPLDIIVAVAALTAVGAVPILISPQLDIETLRLALAPVGAVSRVVTTDARLADAAHLTVRDRVDDWAELAATSAGLAPRAEPAVALPGAAPYVVTHTSGTTGVPKLVQYTRTATHEQSRVQEIPARVGRLRGYAAVAVSPVHYRTMVGLLAALRRDVPLIILAETDPDFVGPILSRWRPSYLETQPNTFMRWEVLADTGALRSVKCFLSTFDVVHPGTVRRLLAGSEHRFAVYLEVYGQSECGGIAGRMHLKGVPEVVSRARRLEGHRVGWTIPWYARTRVVDARGSRVRPGGQGRIQVRSKGRFSAYINNPAATWRNLSHDDWWDTGDWGQRNLLGGITLIDRQVERLTTAASGIALEDILLRRMPWLLEAIVLERDGYLIPVVAGRDDAFDADAWRDAVRDLPDLGKPIVVGYHGFPRTATGKIQRSILASMIAER
ncbi:AMP-binding protein [Nocardia takedensis]